jgi:hypothetical protein
VLPLQPKRDSRVYIGDERRMETPMERKISLFSESAWDALAEVLRRKFLISPKLSEEDLRYCVVETLESFGMFPKGSIHLNYQHPFFEGKRVDLFLPAYYGQDAIVCELKYDRTIPSGYNQPRSMKAGAILNDLLRLAHFRANTEVERFLIHLTDREMLNYLQNPPNGFAPLFSDQTWPLLVITSSFLGDRASSVKKMVKVPDIECSVFTALRQDVGQNHHLSVFFVQPHSLGLSE